MQTTPFQPWSHAFWGLAWFAVVVHGWSALVLYDPVYFLSYPADSARRITGRDLELAEAIEHSRGLERTLMQGLYGTLAEARDAAAEIQQSLVVSYEDGDLPPEDPFALQRARDRLALLLAEGAQLQDTDEGVPERRPSLGDADGEDWYSAREAAAVAREAGDEARARAIEARLLERGMRWKRRSEALLGANLLLVGAGLLLFAAGLFRAPHALGRLLRGGGPEGFPPWDLGTGLGVFIRGDFWNRLYFVALGHLDSVPGLGPALQGSWLLEVLDGWATLIASIPLLWLVHRHLLARGARRASATFGLDLRRIGIGRILGVTLVALALDLAGTQALGWAMWGLDLQASWAEGLDELLVWGSPLQAAITGVDYVAWAPAFEELAFRGLLYYSLRRVMGPVPAALASAAFFALLHFYTLPGFLTTMWSAVVWALAFEKVHSLVPGIVAHAAYNGLYLVGVLLLYR